MGQARKSPRKKETKEEVLKKEISASVSRRATTKINEVKGRVDSLEEQVADVQRSIDSHIEESTNKFSQLRDQLEALERRLLSLIETIQEDIEKTRDDKGQSSGEERQSPSPF